MTLIDSDEEEEKEGKEMEEREQVSKWVNELLFANSNAYNSHGWTNQPKLGTGNSIYLLHMGSKGLRT